MAVRKTRNDSDFWYCMYDPSVQYAVIDENGNETGQIIPSYEEPISMWANVSPAAGVAQFQQFGNLGSFDKVIVTRDMTCPIDENTVLFLDKQPEYTEIVTHVIIGDNSQYTSASISTVTYQLPKYDYIVKNVAKGLDAIAIAVRKVDVG